MSLCLSLLLLCTPPGASQQPRLPSVAVRDAVFERAAITEVLRAQGEKVEWDLVYGWAQRESVAKLVQRYPWMSASQAEALKREVARASGRS